MLVLTRRKEETICIGPDIEVKVLGCGFDGDGKPWVKLGVTAPRSVLVLRSELKDDPPWVRALRGIRRECAS